jgi:hypothetical protein
MTSKVLDRVRRGSLEDAMSGCERCELVRINGHVVHEIGCPAAKRECAWCGQWFTPECAGAART